MDVEKIKNFTDEELAHQELQAREQLFRLRFQIRSGQQEGVKKLRELRKDVARMKTVARFRTLYGSSVATGKAGLKKAAVTSSETVEATAAKPAAKATGKAVGKKTAAKKSGKKAGPNKTVKKAAGKKAAAKKAGKKATGSKKATGRKAGK
jgi:large subunit ribosomal protein L29